MARSITDSLTTLTKRVACFGPAYFHLQSSGTLHSDGFKIRSQCLLSAYPHKPVVESGGASSFTSAPPRQATQRRYSQWHDIGWILEILMVRASTQTMLRNAGMLGRSLR